MSKRCYNCGETLGDWDSYADYGGVAVYCLPCDVQCHDNAERRIDAVFADMRAVLKMTRRILGS